MSYSTWLIGLAVSAVIGWIIGRRRGALVALATSGVWLAVLRLTSVRQSPRLPTLVELVPALAFLVVAGGLVFAMMRTLRWFKRSHQRDPDTGLVRADSFAELVGAELTRSVRYDRPFSLIYIRNEMLAPETSTLSATERRGLRPAVAAVLTSALRSVDLAAELRDGEFAVLMPETGAETVLAVAQRVQDALPTSLEGDRRSASSVGIVTVADARIEAQALIERSRDLTLQSGSDDAPAVRHEILALAPAVL